MKRILEDEAYSEIDALHVRQKIYQHIIKSILISAIIKNKFLKLFV